LAGETGTRDGHVSFVSRRVDVSTGGLGIEIAFDAPVTAPIGLTVTTNIIVDQRDAALTVPRTAILTSGDQQGVLLVRDGTAQFQALTMVDWPAARLIVSDGLAAGDQVVTDAAGITPGQTVTVETP
jgi:membrane fusion protein (multidrug efflux system)